MNTIHATITLAAVLAIPALAQTSAPIAAGPIQSQTWSIEGNSIPPQTFGEFEASVLAGLDRQVHAQQDTLLALRDKYKEDSPEVQTAKLKLAVLQARRDKLARTNTEIASLRIAAILDLESRTRAAGQPAAHETLFDFSKSQTTTGTITILSLAKPYSVVTINVAGTPTDVFLASLNALAAGGWTPNSVKPGDTITVTGAPARGGSPMLPASEVSFNGKPLFSRPAVELTQAAVATYEK